MSTQPHTDVLHHPAEARREWNGWLLGLLASTALVLAVTGVIWLLKAQVQVLGLSVLYLFAVLPIAVFWGLALAVPVSIASMLAFNFFFLPPTYSFTLRDSSNWFALGVFLVTAVVVSDLAARSRRRATESTLLAEISASLLERGELRAELDRIAGDAARALQVEKARIVAPAPAGRGPGFTPKELQWILIHAPSETLILRPDPTLAEGARLARALEAVA